MQLTWTNVVFSRIAMVSCFCAENQLSGKILEKMAKSIFYPKTHGYRRRNEGGLRGAHTMAWREPGLAAQGQVWPPRSPPRVPLSPIYCLCIEKIEGFVVFPERVPLLRRHQKPQLGDQTLRPGTLPARGFGGDHHHFHH